MVFIEEIKHCSIYCFTNLINNKKYIGSTINDPKIRYSQHIRKAFSEGDSTYNYPLYNSIRKRGIENYKFEVIFEKDCTEKEIREIEHNYIIKYNTLFPNGYNQTTNTLSPPSSTDPKIAKKNSETKREKSKKIAEVDLNNNILHIWRSLADCLDENYNLIEGNVSKVCSGKTKSTQGRIFRYLDNNDNLILPNNYQGPTSKRKVLKIDLQTQEILDIYESISAAARAVQCNSSSISRVCSGEKKTCCGFGWKYAE